MRRRNRILFAVISVEVMVIALFSGLWVRDRLFPPPLIPPSIAKRLPMPIMKRNRVQGQIVMYRGEGPNRQDLFKQPFDVLLTKADIKPGRTSFPGVPGTHDEVCRVDVRVPSHAGDWTPPTASVDLPDGSKAVLSVTMDSTTCLVYFLVKDSEGVYYVTIGGGAYPSVCRELSASNDETAMQETADWFGETGIKQDVGALLYELLRPPPSESAIVPLGP